MRVRPSPVLCAAALLLALCASARAAIIQLDETGDSNVNNSSTSFYGVQFSTGLGTEFIQQITYTLPTGVFDNISSVPLNNVDGGSLNGLVLGDITFTPANGSGGPNGNTLTVSFAAGSFGASDSFRFGFDVDGLGAPDPLSGAEQFATKGVAVSVTMESGIVSNGAFSLANFTALPTPVATLLIVNPEPGALALYALGLGLGAMVVRRRRRAARSPS